MSFADEWGKVYDRSVQAFSGRKKVAVRELEDVVKGTSALVTSLAALDGTDPSLCREDEVAERYKDFVAEQKKLEKAAAKYAGTLDKAIQATDKDLHPEAYRELKVLRKHLDWVVNSVGSKAVNYSKDYQKALDKVNAKIGKTTEKLRDRGLGDDEINVELNYLRQQKLLKAFPSLCKTALAKAAAAVQKVKADPTAANYNTVMDDGGRDLSQQMSNVIKLIGDPKCPESLVREVTGLAGYRAALADFGNGDKRRVAEGATRAEVLAQLQEFSGLVKDMMPYYQKVVKFLGKHKL